MDKQNGYAPRDAILSSLKDLMSILQGANIKPNIKDYENNTFDVIEYEWDEEVLETVRKQSRQIELMLVDEIIAMQKAWGKANVCCGPLVPVIH
jgi:hypothetical protein